MTERTALLRVFDELLWRLRRAGLRVSTAQAVDALRVVQLVGLERKAHLRSGLAAVLVTRSADRRRFDGVFDDFFLPGAVDDRRSLWERLAAQGFTEEDLEPLRTLLSAMAGAPGADVPSLGTLLERGPALDRLLQLAGVVRTLEGMQSRGQTGFYAHRVLRTLRAPEAKRDLAALRDRLVGVLGEARAGLLVAALDAELERLAGEVRAHVEGTFARREADQAEDQRRGGIDGKLFAALDEVEQEAARAAVRRFAERLRGGERVRRRRARRGRIDPHRTMRRALSTFGVPFAPARRVRHRDRPELMLLCDVSDSVRSAATFMLELAYAAQELFARTRSFVFVSELGETTALFREHLPRRALGEAYGGAVISVADNSNYGRVLRAFEERHLRDVTRKTTVVILGDGRTNFHDDGADVLGRIRQRARALVWLCPEPRARWTQGDSAMPRYAPHCSVVIEAQCVRDLEEALRTVASLRR